MNNRRLTTIALVTLVAGGCIFTKDMAQDDTGDDGGTSSGATTSGPPTSAGATATAGESSGSTSTPLSTTSGASTGSFDTGSTLSGSGTDPTAGETDGAESLLCTESGGTWDSNACGDYVCGAPNDCDAVVPGCDCGPTANYQDGVGCVVDDACNPQFACGDALACTLDAEYCEVVHPGVKGPPTYQCLEMPAACTADPSCTCLDSEGVTMGIAECNAGVRGGLTVVFSLP